MKIQRAEEAIESGNVSKTARKYGIHVNSMKGWISQLPSLREAKIKTRKGLHPGPKVTGQHLEGLARSFIIANMGPPARATSVQSIALNVLKEDPNFLRNGGNEADSNQFSRVISWVRRFMDRDGFSIRKPTHTAQNDVEVCMDFVKHVVEVAQRCKIPRDCIVNMDQTNIPFDVSARTTVVPMGVTTVNLNKIPALDTEVILK